MVYKCKICGGTVSIDHQSGIAVCDYCGTKQVLPQFTSDSAQILYERGNQYLLQGEYDKAENIFNQLIALNPQDPELYWDLVLCKYGVTFVCDPQTGQYIPTCNRTHFDSIFNDENYQKAVQLSTEEKETVYKENAQTIHTIQQGILAVSKKEKPFDIFISYKETDANGNRTKDSIIAQDLYEKLTEAGYKVFFSRITLEDKLGTAYEPYIYSALYSSKVMLTVCSSAQNIESVWVKNEWSRYLALRQRDSSKTILPLYVDMSREELPDEFAMLSSYDISAEGFEQELIRGIKKLIPLPIMRAQRRKRNAKIVGITAAVVGVVGVIGTAVILPGYLKNQKLAADYAGAMALFEKGDYTAAAEAFASLEDYKDAATMAEKAGGLYQNIKLDAEYAGAMALFESADYTAAEEAFASLGDYRDAAEMKGKCKIQPKYDAAMQLYYEGNYAEAAWAFNALGDYEDSVEQKDNAERSWRHAVAVLMAREMGGGTREHYYYINNNGTMSDMSSTAYTPYQNISLREHGKIVSISARSLSGTLGIIHEDGYISNIESSVPLTDVIKISGDIESPSKVNSGHNKIALHTDGTLSFVSNTLYDKNSYHTVVRDVWVNAISQWTNIIDFEFYYELTYDEGESAIIAIKTDRTLCGFTNRNYDSYETNYGISREQFENMDKVLSNFSKVKSLKFEGNGHPNSKFSIVALTEDGKLQTYIDGTFSERDAKDIVDVVSTELLLTNAGTIVALDGYRVYARDAVFADGYRHEILYTPDSASEFYYVSRTGLINGDSAKKTTVQPEWTSRLN